MPRNATTLETWAFVEIFGHHKVAGRLSERKLGTEVMFQIDVPKCDTEISHTELYSPKSIFSIKPTTEEWCRRWAKAATAMGHSVLPYIPKVQDPVLIEDHDDPDGED